ncbi:MAG: LysR family transcriptional regulator [Bacteriovoracaceae bacterium]|nr:LysR family transcriptional regulator [Bacteriovoracaceae bacterium]
MIPDLNRLKVFYEIYSQGSIVKASRELHITASAVSQHLKQLEKEMKTSLFTRNNRNLIPTLASERLYEITGKFMEELEDTINQISITKERPCGLLRIGAPSEFGSRFLAIQMALFRKKYPEVNFKVLLGGQEKLVGYLFDNKVDLVFTDDAVVFVKNPLLAISNIYDEKNHLVCSREYHRKNLKDGITYKKLMDCDYISDSDLAPELNYWFQFYYKKSFSKKRLAFVIENLQGVLSLVKGNSGLGVIPEYIIKDELNNGRLIAISPSSKQLINKIGLVQLADKIPSLAEKVFIKEIQKKICSQK